jgi:hypothetical protein
MPHKSHIGHGSHSSQIASEPTVYRPSTGPEPAGAIPLRDIRGTDR